MKKVMFALVGLIMMLVSCDGPYLVDVGYRPYYEYHSSFLYESPRPFYRITPPPPMNHFIHRGPGITPNRPTPAPSGHPGSQPGRGGRR